MVTKQLPVLDSRSFCSQKLNAMWRSRCASDGWRKIRTATASEWSYYSYRSAGTLGTRVTASWWRYSARRRALRWHYEHATSGVAASGASGRDLTEAWIKRTSAAALLRGENCVPRWVKGFHNIEGWGNDTCSLIAIKLRINEESINTTEAWIFSKYTCLKVEKCSYLAAFLDEVTPPVLVCCARWSDVITGETKRAERFCSMDMETTQDACKNNDKINAYEKTLMLKWGQLSTTEIGWLFLLSRCYQGIHYIMPPILRVFLWTRDHNLEQINHLSVSADVKLRVTTLYRLQVILLLGCFQGGHHTGDLDKFNETWSVNAMQSKLSLQTDYIGIEFFCWRTANSVKVFDSCPGIDTGTTKVALTDAVEWCWKFRVYRNGPYIFRQRGICTMLVRKHT